MDQVFKPFVDRFSQPIILSFIVAWIFWNWKIPLGLIWYDKESISLLGYSSYEDLIAKNINIVYNFIGPALTAFLYPLVILIANNFTAFVRKIDIKLLHVISKGSIVPWELYHNAIKLSDEREKSISRFVSQEKELTLKLFTLETSSSKIEERLRLVSEENSRNIDLLGVAKDEISEKLQLINIYRKFSEREWLVGEHQLELWETQSKSSITKLHEAKILFYFKDDYFYFDVYNKGGKVTFQVGRYFYNIINETCLMTVIKLDFKDNDDINFQKDILAYIIFRDIEYNIVEFRVNTNNSSLRSSILNKKSNLVYEIEIK